MTRVTGEYVDVHGVRFTDADIEVWAAEDESEDGFTGRHRGVARKGRPVSALAQPLTLALDEQQRAKLVKLAQERQTTVPELVRQLIDAL